MNNILSYLWPQTKKVDSDFNGVLEITRINGRKLLNSKNANYSFGTLQRILEIGLSKIDFKKVDSVLLLGLGAGSIIVSLRNKFDFNKSIVAVEIDPKIIAIADKEFAISPTDQLSIKNQDAFEYVKNCTNKYDLIIVDLFIDNKVPTQFYTKEFNTHLTQLLEPEGKILFNLGMGLINNEVKDKVVLFFKETMELKTQLIENVLNTNTLLLVGSISKST